MRAALFGIVLAASTTVALAASAEERAVVNRPSGAAWPRACSDAHPICVHAEAGSMRRAVDVLAAADRAWDLATGALAMPAPFADRADPYDVYLTDGALGGGQSFAAERDTLSYFDRARAFTIVDRAAKPGCALDHVILREVLRASLFASAPGTDEGSARAETEQLARLAAPCPVTDADGIAEFQKWPQRALVDTLAEAPPVVGDLYDRGASIFFGWLDETFGSGPGAIVRALWALAPTRTPIASAAWSDEPDGFDVLRSSFKGQLGAATTIDDLFVDFALARALAFGGAHLELDEPWPEKAAAYVPANPPMPSGASYLRFAVRPDKRLRVEIEWEAHTRMRWVVVKLDASGNAIGTLPIASMDRGTDANVTVNDLRGAASVLLVGVNLGPIGVDFDPDDREWEPHAWLVTVEGR